MEEEAISNKKPPLLVDTKAFRKGLQKTCETIELTPQKQIEKYMNEMEESPMITKLKSPDRSSWVRCLFKEQCRGDACVDAGSNLNGMIHERAQFHVDTLISRDNQFVSRRNDSHDTHRLTKTLERSLRDSLESLSQIKLKNKQEKKELAIRMKDLKEELIFNSNKKQMELEDELQNTLEQLRTVEIERDERIQDLENQLMRANTLNNEINQDNEVRQKGFRELEIEKQNIIDNLNQEKIEREERIKTLENELKDVQISAAEQRESEILSLRNYTEMLEQINTVKTDEIKALEAKLEDANTECEANVVKKSEMKKNYDEETANLEKQVYALNTKLRMMKLQNQCFIQKQEEQLSDESHTIEELREKLSNNITATTNIGNQVKKVVSILLYNELNEDGQQYDLKELLLAALNEFDTIHQIHEQFESTFEKQSNIISEKKVILYELQSDAILQNTENVFFESQEVTVDDDSEKFIYLGPSSTSDMSTTTIVSKISQITEDSKNKLVLGRTTPNSDIRLPFYGLGSGIMGSFRGFTSFWNKKNSSISNPRSNINGTDIDNVENRNKNKSICEGMGFIENDENMFNQEIDD